jgi:Survival motor neuron (SMN) interacting protein 1 (SIP1)
MAYLRSVRWEAASIPGVSRAALDPLQFESRRTAYTPCIASFQPPPPGAEVRSGSRTTAGATRRSLTGAQVKQEWRQEFVSHFSVRVRCGRLASGGSAHAPSPGAAERAADGGVGTV